MYKCDRTLATGLRVSGHIPVKTVQIWYEGIFFNHISILVSKGKQF